VAERGGPPLLVADQQQRDLGVVLAALGERAHDPEREHDAALHVDRAGADQLVAVALQRAVGLVRDHGVDVAEQQDAAAAGAAEVDDEVVGVVGRRAGDALEARVVGRERRADGDALVGAVAVAAGRGDGHERLQLARRAAGDLLRALGDPLIHGQRTLPGYRLRAMPELPEMEITARRVGEALTGETIESVVVPGINALKTFDPPLSALEGATLDGVRRRGKLLLLDAGGLVLLTHLMSAGRLQLFEKRASMRDRTMRVGIRLPGDRELRLREFGTRQRAWVKLLRPEDVDGDEALARLGPEAWPDPPELGPLLKAPRPLHTLLRDQQVIAGIGRTWVDEILHAAKLSPFKRGDDLSDEEAEALREATIGELGRVLDVYEEKVAMPLPEKFPKPTRVHNHQGEPCPRCEAVLEAVFYEDYVMTYCPSCQTEGRVLKDRRLSRLLK
jgi:formamidopyrimidine-DNA glycosylase